MNSLGNFLWKIFSVTMVFFCHTVPDSALAASAEPYIADDPKITSKLFSSTGTSKTTSSQRVCAVGYYLYSCGGVQLGTNWLKGMKKSYEDSTVTTPDYYSYGAEYSDAIHMENLRKFFAGQEPIIYTLKSTHQSNQVLPATYTPYLNQILSNFCTDDNGKLSVRCEICPNNATISKSTVRTDYDSGKILWDSWNVHTIADCYMKEFEDDTGTYVYVSNAVSEQTSDKAETCNYSPNTSGEELFYN